MFHTRPKSQTIDDLEYSLFICLTSAVCLQYNVWSTMAVLVMDEAVREKLTNHSDHSSYIYHNIVIG